MKGTVTILIPALNEEQALPDTIASLLALDPRPDRIILADGGSGDSTQDMARMAGIEVLACSKRGRGAQINAGVAASDSEIVCVLHADTLLPVDAVSLMRSAMADTGIALASFMPRICGANRTRWGSTLNNLAKTWYVPLLFRPHLFLRGVRLLFGDHAMFFRREQFLAIGGCDERAVVLEEVGLCIGLARFGRTRMVRRWARTSDRRIVAWGRWRANWIYLKVGLLWAMGERETLAASYPDVR